MKVYLIDYYRDTKDSYEIVKIVDTEDKAIEYCKNLNQQDPYTIYTYQEWDVE